MQRDRRYRCRLAPYNRHQLPPCEDRGSAVVEENSRYLECENMNMHNDGMQFFTETLENLPQGFVSITDRHLITKETVWILTPKYRTGSQQFTAMKGERLVYAVKWKGGGSLTVRVK
ncbi:E4 ORF6/7 [human adenovirus 52]|uniref:E4 ORF6/7 n=1 Tax=human adenovirus 52 TaxID=332179 RepID=A0MK72_9ADEN|nr:E4 ORF6/7 [Human adenovirus 52]